ncbi:MAG TPA: hypothetical protein VK914_02755 [bacterium]|nr:hypothetical protein [bacterium]
MYCNACGHELESQGNFCRQCRQPILERETPRTVRLRQDPGLFAKILAGCLLYGGTCLAFLYFIVGPIAVKHFGTPTTAIVESVVALEQREGYTYRINVQYKNGRGDVRFGRDGSSAAEFKAQPQGETMTVRYFDGYPYVGRDGPDDVFDECFTVVFFIMAALLMYAVLKQLNYRKRMLAIGTLHEAVVTGHYGHKRRILEVEYGEGVRTPREIVFRGPQFPKTGSKIWVLEDGTKDGIVILEPTYEWECAHIPG